MTAITLEWARANAAWHFAQWQVHFIRAQDMKRLFYSLSQFDARHEPQGLLRLMADIQHAEADEQLALGHLLYLKTKAQLKKTPRRHLDIDDLPRPVLRKMLEGEPHNDSSHAHKEEQQQRLLWHMVVLFLLFNAAKRNNTLTPFVLWF